MKAKYNLKDVFTFISLGFVLICLASVAVTRHQKMKELSNAQPKFREIQSVAGFKPFPIHTPFQEREPNRVVSQQLQAVAADADKKFQKDFYKRYFHQQLMRQKNVSTLYNSIKTRLPNSKNSELVSIFIAKGFGHDPNPEYSAFIAQIYRESNLNSQEIYHDLSDNYEIFQSDPFAFQVMLNLAASLNISTAQKAELIGRSLNGKFEIDDKGQISPASASMSIAWILMKKNGVPATEVVPYYKQGLEKNKNNPVALKEFQTRAKIYYPNLVF